MTLYTTVLDFFKHLKECKTYCMYLCISFYKSLRWLTVCYCQLFIGRIQIKPPKNFYQQKNEDINHSWRYFACICIYLCVVSFCLYGKLIKIRHFARCSKFILFYDTLSQNGNFIFVTMHDNFHIFHVWFKSCDFLFLLHKHVKKDLLWLRWYLIFIRRVVFSGAWDRLQTTNRIKIIYHRKPWDYIFITCFTTSLHTP